MKIDTALPDSDPLRLRKNYLVLTYKMKITDEIKILDKKIMQNESQ